MVPCQKPDLEERPAARETFLLRWVIRDWSSLARCFGRALGGDWSFFGLYGRRRLERGSERKRLMRR